MSTETDHLSILAQCMADTPADHPEAEKLYDQARRLAETPASLRALADHYDQLAGGGPAHAAELRARAAAMETTPLCRTCGCRYEACNCPKWDEPPAPSRETPPTEPGGHTEWGYDLNHTIAEMDGEEWGLTVCQIPGSGGIGKGRVMPEDAAHARLIVAACNSYRRHFGPQAAQAAEDDVLGAALDAIQQSVWALENYEERHAVRFGIIDPLRVVLARVQRREA